MSVDFFFKANRRLFFFSEEGHKTLANWSRSQINKNNIGMVDAKTVAEVWLSGQADALLSVRTKKNGEFVKQFLPHMIRYVPEGDVTIC